MPESKAWLDRRKAGTLRRPSIGELFSPQLRRVTLVTAGLSACAYAVAFGALQLTPTQIVPGLPDLAEQRKILTPLQDDARALIVQLANCFTLARLLHIVQWQMQPVEIAKLWLMTMHEITDFGEATIVRMDASASKLEENSQ